jgi:hypothetical protein
MKTPSLTKENNRLFIFSLFFILLFNSCKDKEQYVYYISQETKDYCVFQTGTWWEYENINTHEIDTYFITQATNNIKPTRENNISQQEISMRYKRTLTYNNEFLINIDVGPWNKDDLLILVGETYLYQPQLIAMQYFEMRDSLFIDSDDSVKYLKYFTSFQSNLTNISYHNVKVFDRTTNINSLFAQKTYWSKNIGVIRREMFDGSIWELKSYNIIQ